MTALTFAAHLLLANLTGATPVPQQLLAFEASEPGARVVAIEYDAPAERGYVVLEQDASTGWLVVKIDGSR